jgi:hypothetical protein
MRPKENRAVTICAANNSLQETAPAAFTSAGCGQPSSVRLWVLLLSSMPFGVALLFEAYREKRPR